MKKLFSILVAMLFICASAKSVVGEIGIDVALTKDKSRKTYTVVVDVPDKLTAKKVAGKLTFMKNPVEKLWMTVASHTPSVVQANGRRWAISDTSVRSELLLPSQFKMKGATYASFSFYRRLNPKRPDQILVCQGIAKDKATVEAMLQLCRSAKLK